MTDEPTPRFCGHHGPEARKAADRANLRIATERALAYCSVPGCDCIADMRLEPRRRKVRP